MRRPSTNRDQLKMLIGMTMAFALSLCALEYGNAHPLERASTWIEEEVTWIEEDHVPITRKLPDPPRQQKANVITIALAPKPRVNNLPVVNPVKQYPDFEIPDNPWLFPGEEVDAPLIPKPTDFPDVQPEFPGGDSALYMFLRDNLQYPPFARENQIEGPVYLKFTIGADGRIDPVNVEVLRSPHETLSAEAIRVVKRMPRWKPGRQRLQNVPVYMKLPVQFKLQ